MQIYDDTNFGFVPSQMDGTEWVFSSPAGAKLPKKYTYRPYLPTVIDQGSLSICVPCSCSAYLNWKQNLKDGSAIDNKVALMDIYSIRTNPGDGMSFKEALHYLRHEGVRSKAGQLKINSYGTSSPVPSASILLYQMEDASGVKSASDRSCAPATLVR